MHSSELGHRDRLERLKEVGVQIADQAAALKEVADTLREDVDALAARMTAVEEGNITVADELVKSDERVEGQQVVQDDRLDTLENGD